MKQPKEIWSNDRMNSFIHPSVVIESDVYIGPNCIIGYPAENIDTWPNCEGKVIIRSGAIITGNVTIDSGTEKHTEIGSGCFIMKGVHIGHDAVLIQDVRLAPGVKIGGHCEIGKRVSIGMNAVIVNRCNVGNYSMVGAGAVVVKAYPVHPKRVFVGNPAKDKGPNIAGIKYWINRDPQSIVTDYLYLPEQIDHIPKGIG